MAESVMEENYGNPAYKQLWITTALAFRLLPVSRKGTLLCVIVADEAFPLKENLMKPYPAKSLDDASRVFNYRLSRARRVSENAFGILVHRFRIFQSTIPLGPKKAEVIVLAAVALHNYLRTKSVE